MLNHLRTCLVGGNFRGLARALFLGEAFLLACPAWPLPPPRPAEAVQIVEFVDDQGRRIYVNVQEQDSGLGNRASASKTHSFPPKPELASLIQKAAERHHLDPDLIHAIVHVESGYDSQAVSSKGAIGLMQLIPATARRFGVGDPFDPRQNIEGGTSYLKYLLGLFDGNVALSLAAYNAGENSVLRQDGIPPFAETREYVRKVRSIYQSVATPEPSDTQASAGASGVRTSSRKRPGKSGKATEQTPEPADAPFYTYIDAQGVMHIEQ
jgi:soluble lytic murein transglycosylase-like protein